MKHLILASAATAALAACAPAAGGSNATPGQCSGSASYTITYQANWTASSANAAIPGNAHFSPAFAATHSDTTHLYQAGTPASAGIRQMAETGATSILNGETNALKSAGLLRDTGKGSRLDAIGTTSISLNANSANDQLTLVSMIAPSPDWYVGIDSLSLCQGGQWISNYSADLSTYDAGTDSGATFAAANAATSPQARITYLDKDLQEQPRRTDAVFGRIIVSKN